MFFLAGPAHDFLPAPLWLLTALQVLTLTLHLLAMNFLVGGLFLGLTLRLGDRWRNPAVRRLIKVLPVTMAATVSLGVAPLLFAQLVYGSPFYSASIISARYWFAVPLVLILAYYALYVAALAREPGSRLAGPAWVALLVLLGVGLVYSSVFSLAEKPDLQVTTYAADQSGSVLNPDLGAWLPRWLHMMTGALAVGGFFFGLLGRDDDRAWAAGRAAFTWGTILAALAGIAYMMSLGDLIRPFMRSPGIGLVTLGALAGLASLLVYRRRRFFWSGALLLVAMLGMVAARHVLRLLALESTFDPAAAPVAPQWGVFAVFVVCLLVAVLLIAWMLRTFFAAPPAGRTAG